MAKPSRDQPQHICYMCQFQSDCLSSRDYICAVSLNGEKRWNREFLNVEIRGLVYLKNPDLLLVTDLRQNKILLLHAKTGEVVQSINLDADVQMVYRILSTDDELLVFQEGGKQLSRFSVSAHVISNTRINKQ